MRKRSHVSPLGMMALFAASVALLLGVSVALASSPAGPSYQPPPPPSTDTPMPPPPTDTPIPPPPPTDTPGPPPPTVVPGPTETPGPPGNGSGTGFLAVLEGFVWENGDPFKPLSGVMVRYTSDSVSADVTTDQKGHFKFVNVGPDGGTLSLADSQWQAGGTGGVVVQLPPGWTFQANLAALPKGKALTSKLTLTCSASSSRATPGQEVTFSLKVINGTQGVVSGLTLGDRLPEGMTASNVTTSRGDVIGRGPSVVSVNLGALAPGDSATVSIVARVSQNAPVSPATNRATLFYREGPAVEAQTTIGAAGGPQALPVTGVGLPIAGVAALVVILIIARRLRTRSAV